MPKPFVGLPTTLTGGCAFAIDIDGEICGKPCVVHLAVRSVAWGIVALASCAAHEAVARSTGEVIDEHPHEPGCEEVECWTVETLEMDL